MSIFYIYIYMPLLHLLFPPALLGRAVGFRADFGWKRGQCVALLPCP